LPFEKDFYERFDMDVSFLGHPLLDEIETYKTNKNKFDTVLNAKPIIALLPGSRKQEIGTMLPIMLQSLKGFENCRFIVAMAPSIQKEFYLDIIQNENVELISNDTYNVLNKSDAALVTSGTATLETALFKVPQIVCYKGSAISFWLAKRLVKVKYISLVNLILNKAAVPELIQGEMNTVNLNKHLKSILNQGHKRNSMLSDYKELEMKLGGAGASERAAKEMFIRLKKSI
jgi:lipid-A-disaccharide synthase